MSLLNRTLWLITFSIAMGFLETAVVVYLRLLYYPHGFGFPLVVLSPEVGIVEILREAATVIMLLGVGVLTGTTPRQRLAYFIMAFAIWDLFYYVFLKVFLDWPESFLTWDILFLIPAPWVGPVLSPVLVCLAMLAFSIILLRNDYRGVPTRIGRRNWFFILMGCLVIVISWMWDYVAYSGRISDAPDKAMEVLATYVPQQFNWWLFGIGEMLILLGLYLYWKKSRQ
jgi:uncharacterized membrane protein